MKKLLIAIIATLFCAVTTAQNKVVLSTAKGHPGDVVTVDVTLQNSDEIVVAELQIPLNDEMKYVEGSCILNEARKNGHQVTAGMKEGKLCIVVFDFGLKPLNGNCGELLSFNLQLKKTPRTYPLTADVVVAGADGNAYETTLAQGAVTILSPEITVETKSVDYGHIPIRDTYTRYATLRNSGNEVLEITGVEFSATEFSANETVFSIQPGESKSVAIDYAPTVRGAVSENVTFYSNAINGKQVVTLVADPFSVNELHVGKVSGYSDEEVTVSLTMNNMEPIVGMQCEFALPEQLEYVAGSFKPSERAIGLTANGSVVDGKLKLILYSFSGTEIEGNDGEIATFKLRLNGNSGYYYLNPENVVLSNAGIENMTSATERGYVQIKSPSMRCESSLIMGESPITETAKAKFNIKNNGNADLKIEKVSFLAQGYSIAEELPINIAPWQSSEITVQYVPLLEGEHSTLMNIYTNDPQNRMKQVKVSGSIYEPNNLTLDGENLQNGDYLVSVGLENYTDIVAIQMDIHWLPGMTTSSDMLKVSDRLKGHSYSITKYDEDTYRFVAFSFSNKAVEGNEGKLFDLTFTPQGDMDYKDTPILIDNVVLSSSGANNYTSQLAVNANAEFKNFYVRFVYEGQVVSESFQRVGTPIVQPTMPEKTGYTFGGWKNVPEISPSIDVEYTGQYNPNKYKIDYVVNGMVFDTDSVKYGSPIILRDAPIKIGHTFSGWSEAPAIMPASDIIIEGSFTVNSYSVIYNVDGEEYHTEMIAYGSEITLIEEPVKEGYTFSGWREVPATMPAEDITIEGTFAVNSYTVTYIVDGEVYKTDTVEYGAEIVLPGDDEIVWDNKENIPSVMPANDIVITGTIATGIKALYGEDRVVVFDLSGNRILDCENLKRGVYIINGKKVLVK